MADEKKKAAEDKAAEEESPDKDVETDAEGRPSTHENYDPDAEISEESKTGEVAQP